MSQDPRLGRSNRMMIEYWLVAAAVAITALVGYTNTGRNILSIMNAVNGSLLRY